MEVVSLQRLRTGQLCVLLSGNLQTWAGVLPMLCDLGQVVSELWSSDCGEVASSRLEIACQPQKSFFARLAVNLWNLAIKHIFLH